MAKSNLELAQQTQERFYFYMTALVFTVLGLSIQTGSFGKSHISDSFEILSWILFLLSGLAALYRLELVPNVYESADGLSKLKKQKTEVLQSKERGGKEIFVIEDDKPEDINKYLKELNTKINTLDKHIKSLKESLYRRYSIHRWAFVFGLLSIIIARTYLPLSNILKACNG